MKNNSSNIDYGKRAPPASLFPPDSPDEAELEEQFQQAMQDEDERRRFEEYLNSDPEGPSNEEIEDAERQLRESVEERERMRAFERDFNESEAMVTQGPVQSLLYVAGTPPVSQPVQQALPTAPATATIRSPAPSSTKLPMPPLDMGKSPSKRPGV